MEEGITPAGVQLEGAFDAERSSGSCSSMIWSGDADALERHGIKEMLGLMDETLTEYFRDPNITNACKKRVWHCMKERIDDLYKRFFPGEDLLRDERRLQHEQGRI